MEFPNSREFCRGLLLLELPDSRKFCQRFLFPEPPLGVNFSKNYARSIRSFVKFLGAVAPFGGKCSRRSLLLELPDPSKFCSRCFFWSSPIRVNFVSDVLAREPPIEVNFVNNQRKRNPGAHFLWSWGSQFRVESQHTNQEGPPSSRRVEWAAADWAQRSAQNKSPAWAWCKNFGGRGGQRCLHPSSKMAAPRFSSRPPPVL